MMKLGGQTIRIEDIRLTHIHTKKKQKQKQNETSSLMSHEMNTDREVKL